MKISLKPKSSLGKLSLLMIIFCFVFFGLFFLLVSLGEKGGETFFSNLKLTIPFLLAGISGVFSVVAGFIGIIKNKENSIFVFLATLIGFFILLWILGEFLFPH